MGLQDGDLYNMHRAYFYITEDELFNLIIKHQII